MRLGYALLLATTTTLLACGDDSDSGGAGGQGGAGGSATGGDSTGGSATGGTGATGGSATGGAGATGGTATGGAGGAGGDGGTGNVPFEATTATIEDGGVFPVEHACLAYAGATDTNPAFTWTPGPEGTQSYAIYFHDLTFNEFPHSAIWDIPASATGIPAAVQKVAEPADPAGSKQCPAWHEQFNGYAGPCPGDQAHDYQFIVYALDVATLPDVTTASALEDVKAALDAHALESVTITATFTPPN